MKSTEDQLQIACMDYLRWKHPDLLALHIPNGGSRHALEAKKLKRMGVVAGMPDIFIPKAREVGRSEEHRFTNMKHRKECDICQWRCPECNHVYNGFFCELKIKPNKPTKIQSEIHNKLMGFGYYVCVCYTLDEFIKEVENYLRN